MITVIRTAISAIPHRAHARAKSARQARIATLSSIFAGLLSCFLPIAGCGRAPARSESALPDVQVVDAHGASVSLGSLKGKVVLLEFIHLGCQNVCETLITKFGQIAGDLGPDLGSRVVLLSITNEPEEDTPEKLLKLARSSKADMNGWLFLTGKPEAVEGVLSAFGLKAEKMPDGSAGHITRVFLLGPDLRKTGEYQGLIMNPQTVVADIKHAIYAGDAS